MPSTCNSCDVVYTGSIFRIDTLSGASERKNMDYFNYKNGKLFTEQLDIEKIADEVGTPTFVYSKATFLDHLRAKGIEELALFSDVEFMGSRRMRSVLRRAREDLDVGR